MRRPVRRGLGAAGALALAAACATQPHAAAAATLRARLAGALNSAADVLAEEGQLPPFPSSLYASFGVASQQFPILAPLQPTVDALAAPPGPPLFSTVDPSALVYVGPPAAPDAQADATTTTAEAPTPTVNVQ